MIKVQNTALLRKFCIVRDLTNVLHRLLSLESQYIPQIVTRLLIGQNNHVCVNLTPLGLKGVKSVCIVEIGVNQNQLII